jgi:DNA-directed RNA polymerase subunit RPC12/RpoP
MPAFLFVVEDFVDRHKKHSYSPVDMTIDFTCHKCGGSFELDPQELLDGSEKIECPHCDASPSQAMMNDFIAAVADLRSQIALLSKKFDISLSISTEELDEPAEDFDDDDEDDEEDDEDEDDSDEDDDYDDELEDEYEDELDDDDDDEN